MTMNRNGAAVNVPARPIAALERDPRDSRDARPSWKGRPVPPILVAWFDQLMEQAPLILQGSAVHYIDVTLTAASAGNYAKPPQILFK